MENTESSNESKTTSPLKVSIEGRQLLKIKGLILPVNPYSIPVHRYRGIRVNLLHINVWCQICSGRRASHFCETEHINVCWHCNTFCDQMVHNWRPLWETIGEK